MASRTRSKTKTLSQRILDAVKDGDEQLKDHYENLRMIDFGFNDLKENENYAIKHLDTFLENLKDNITLPLHEIKYYNIFKLKNFPLRINSDIIKLVCDEALNQLQGKYTYHLWKLLFIFPTIFNSTINLSETDSSKIEEKLMEPPLGIPTTVKENLSKIKYSTRLISKESIDEMLYEMENWIYQIIRKKN